MWHRGLVARVPNHSRLERWPSRRTIGVPTSLPPIILCSKNTFCVVARLLMNRISTAIYRAQKAKKKKIMELREKFRLKSKSICLNPHFIVNDNYRGYYIICFYVRIHLTGFSTLAVGRMHSYAVICWHSYMLPSVPIPSICSYTPLFLCVCTHRRSLLPT